MTIETLVVWLFVGLIAGWLASAVVGGGYGIVGDIVVGIVGAFLGGWLFRALGVSAPGSGIVGTIVVAFVGAVVLLLLLRALHRTRYRAT
ncbi:MAG TPA: GlsB/YeaQ/YmgE family stress response membrane protein [Archangium sp.]|nr:GlsB/YeaQ/YmgE family stress response membrane protein [Archangium sp.]